MAHQAVEGRLQRRQGRGASCICNEVWPSKVEHIGNPPGNNVTQFAGHGIFGDTRDAAVHALAQTVQQSAAHIRRQRLKIRHGLQYIEVFRQENTQAGAVVILACQSITQDDCHPLAVQWTPRVAVIQQRLA